MKRIQHYPGFDRSRRGWVPDRIVCAFGTGKNASAAQSPNFRILADGTVICHAPVSRAGNFTGLTRNIIQQKAEALPEVVRARGTEADLYCITVATENRAEKLKDKENEALREMMLYLQREYRRLYGEAFPFRREHVLELGELYGHEPSEYPMEELLENRLPDRADATLFRVQTGCYKDPEQAGAMAEKLAAAGIAAYIVPCCEGRARSGVE